MCRICGRLVKCIFDTMPSRVSSVASTRTFTTAARARPTRSTQKHASSKSLVRSTFNVDRKLASNPPTFLLPLRAKLHQATSTQASVDYASQSEVELPPSMLKKFSPTQVSGSQTTNVGSKKRVQPKPLVLSKSVQQLLPLLSGQKPHYITVHLHRFPYLLTTGDTLRLPFHMHGVSSGDVLRLNRASILGSRDYTLKAGTHSSESYDQKRTGEPNYLDERMFEVRARVVGHETGPMFTKEKTKRRNRRVKTVKSKHRYTVLKIMEVRVKSLEELKSEKGALLLES